MTNQTTTPNGDTANAPDQNKYRRRDPAYASIETKRELLRHAKLVAALAAGGNHPASPAVKEQARLLLKAAIDWQASAVQAAAEAGRDPRPRPNFQQAPKPPDLKAQPGPKKYHHHIFFWASKYAWDKRDGLNAKDTARNLVLTAYVGYHNNQTDKPKSDKEEKDNAPT